MTSSVARARSVDVSLEEELLAVQAVLEERGIAHALCGGIAANLYRAEPRATVDVDICVVCSAPELVAVARVFEGAGWEAHPAWRSGELLRLTRRNRPRVDLLIATTQVERQAIERARTFKIGRRTIRVLGPEDLIVLKLVAGRPRDYEAVAAMVNTNGEDLDAAAIERQLAELGFSDRWARALEAAEQEAEHLG